MGTRAGMEDIYFFQRNGVEKGHLVLLWKRS
jgi:hypothetical protein